MSIWVGLQIILNLILLVGLALCFVRIQRQREDNPRLNQGLRLLQSKISVLEDLSDHSENQVNQLMTLLDKKLQEVRRSINNVNEHMVEMDQSIEKSKKMAEVIVNKIPHKEIIERKTTDKYKKAAQMAHQGIGVDRIVSELGLPRNEVQLIAKVNRKKYIFADKENLWASPAQQEEPATKEDVEAFKAFQIGS